MKLKGRLNLARHEELRPSLKVVVGSVARNQLKITNLLKQIDQFNWELKDGTKASIVDIYNIVIVYGDDRIRLFHVKHKQWEAALEDYTKCPNVNVEFEVIKSEDFQYAKIIPEANHYNENSVLKAYEEGRRNVQSNIIMSKTQILNKFKI